MGCRLTVCERVVADVVACGIGEVEEERGDTRGLVLGLVVLGDLEGME